MKEKQENLLKLLLQQDTPISSRMLAEQMNLSVRTIKNYIYDLNKLGASPVITSSNAGYQVIREEAEKLLDKPKMIPLYRKPSRNVLFSLLNGF